VRLRRLAADATILAKIEDNNPAYSVKCPIGAAMVWDTEEKCIYVKNLIADLSQALEAA
jgi:cysteine synthase